MRAGTYRLQLHAGFGLDDAAALVDYLDALGVDTVYASPLTRARSGSAHGYDVTDPTVLDPALGGEEALRRLVGALHRRGMGLLLDIVPNHMAASAENPWWRDLLQHGPASPFAATFDVDWNPPLRVVENKIVLPILGRPYGQTLEGRELQVVFDDGSFGLRYYEWELPLDPATWPLVLAGGHGQLAARLGAGSEDVKAFATVMAALEGMPGAFSGRPDAGPERHRVQRAAREELRRLTEGAPAVARLVRDSVVRINGRRGRPESVDALDELLRRQPYRLAYWRSARDKLNYRRFFNISDLVGVRAEDETVFAATHALVLRLVREGLVDGLRIDHVDGLLDPYAYLGRLRRALFADRHDLPVVVEKILSAAEGLPVPWPVQGTTGYELGAAVDRLAVDEDGLARLDALFRRVTGIAGTFGDVAHARKRHVMSELFPGEMRALEHELFRIAEADRHARDLPPGDLSRVLTAVTASLPVYRTYTRGEEVAAADRAVVETAVREARRRRPGLPVRALAFLRRVLLLDFPPAVTDRQRREWLDFVMHWQQMTGPIAAKGVEDTALYVYNRLVALNEVGGEPDPADLSTAAFHRLAGERGSRWPGTLNATSTHDSKRSEDVRARIAVLSEIAPDWEETVQRWRERNRSKKRAVAGRAAPDGNAELLLYQTLVGIWPLDRGVTDDLRERLQGYMLKALREAKAETSWLRPSQAYEDATRAFVDAILDDDDFTRELAALDGRVAVHGAVNALAGVVLKMAVPGVPDIYRGCEVWDLSLVDPDNRRPVDFARRRALLGELPGAAPAELVAHWRDGRIKLLVTTRALHLRRRLPELFARGEYLPLDATGRHAAHVVTFARRHEGRWAVALAPRLTVALGPGFPIGPVWGDTSIRLPRAAPGRWRDALTGREVATLRIADVLAELPVALLTGPA